MDSHAQRNRAALLRRPRTGICGARDDCREGAAIRLRQPALFNRGNAALAANALDYAIRDYTAALRLQPNDTAAKRNLEIALRKKAQQDESGGKGGQPNPGPPAPQPPSQTPQNGQQKPKGGADVEALLRSVQQQEQEELARMRQQKSVRGHVGW